MKKLLLLISSIILTCSLSSQTIINDSIVSGIWTKENSPYLINRNITVPLDSSLTIESGVKVEFMGNYMVEVNGNFFVNGVYGDSVLFTINDTTGFADTSVVNGGWGGIFINAISQSLEEGSKFYINYAIIEFAKNINRITNPLDFNNKKGGAIEFNNCYKENTKIENIVLRNNYTVNSGGGINVCFGSVNIDKCFIHNNIAKYDGAGIFIISATASINNSIIVNNSCLIGDGGGISINTQSLEVNNSIVANNKARYGELIDDVISEDITVTNSILWDSDGRNSFFSESAGAVYCYNCIINKLTEQTYISGTDCIDEDPGFIAPSSNVGAGFSSSIFDWSIGAKSPGVDRGKEITIDTTDVLGMPRIFNNKIDIGAFEYQGYPAPRGLVFEEYGNVQKHLGEFCGKFSTISNFASPFVYSFSSNDTIGIDSIYFTIRKDSLFYTSPIGNENGLFSLVVRSTDTLNQFCEIIVGISITNPINSTKALLAKNMLVFPNPTNGVIVFQDDIEDYSAELYNIQGKLMRKIDVAEIYSRRIDISDLESGVYFIKFFNSQESVVVKVIKK